MKLLSPTISSGLAWIRFPKPIVDLPDSHTSDPITIRPEPDRYGRTSIRRRGPTLSHWLRNNGSYQNERSRRIIPSRPATCRPYKSLKRGFVEATTGRCQLTAVNATDLRN